MKFIKKWLEKRKEKKQKQAEIHKAKTEKRITVEEQKLESHQNIMFSLQCPFTEKNCFTGCVHFMPGYVASWPGLDGSRMIFAIHSKCLLWNKK